EARWTLAAQVGHWRDEIAVSVRTRLDVARSRCERRTTETPDFAHLADLAEQQQRLEARRADCNAKAQAEQKTRDAAISPGPLGALRRFLASLLSPKRAARLAAEAEGRRAALADESAALDREAAVLGDKWRQACQRLPGEAPTCCDPAAVADARAAWERQ